MVHLDTNGQSCVDLRPSQRSERRPEAPPTPGPHQGASNRAQLLLKLACELTGATYAAAGLFSADQSVAEHVTFGISEESAAGLARSRWLSDLLKLVHQDGRRDFLTELPAGQPLRPLPELLPATGPFLGIPLQCPNQCKGVLYFGRALGGAPFHSNDVEHARLIGAYFEQDNLFEDAHLQARAQLIRQIAQAAAASNDLGVILANILRGLERFFPFHVCAVWLFKGQDLKLAARTASPQGSPEALRLKVGEAIAKDKLPFGECLSEGQALYHDVDSQEQSDESASFPALYQGASSVFTLPLRMGEQTNGLLQSISTNRAGFTREQTQLLYLVADVAGPAIANCELVGQLQTAYQDLRQTQQQLIQSEKMRALGELASGVAHEFNNSLCGTLGFLELVLMEPQLTPPVRTSLESARSCAFDAAQTVRRVQEFARWHDDATDTQRSDLNRLIHQTLELTRPKWGTAAQKMNATVRIDVQVEGPVVVAGNPSELREVITNLVFNAVDAMPQGGTLTIRARQEQDKAVLEVIDTGVGISESASRRLFEPFFTTKGERGTGLGLSVTYGIVQRHGGEITVTSEMGKGSTFRVTLPLAPIEQAADATGSDPVEDSWVSTEKVRSRDAGFRVLVVEDDASVREFLQRALTQLGHHVVTAEDGHEGLAIFHEEEFDLVLTDLGLPGVSGEEIARAVAKQSPETPVILLTGWADQFGDRREKPEAITCVLGKPITIGNLAKALDEACNSHSPASK